MAAGRQAKSDKGVREIRPGVWEMRVYSGLDIRGRQHQVSRVIRGTKRDALKARIKLMVELQGAVPDVDGPMKFGELAERWYQHGSASWKVRTADGYRRLLDQRVLPAIGRRRLEKIRAVDLDSLYVAFIDDGLSPSSVQRIHAVIRAVFNAGVRWELIAKNPADRARPPREYRSEIAPPTIEQIQKLLAAARKADETFGAAAWVATFTGIRRGELVALRWTDIALDPQELVVARSVAQIGQELIEETTKTHAKRLVSLDDLTLRVLTDLRATQEARCRALLGRDLPEDAFIFTHEPDGSVGWMPSYVTQRWARLAKRQGIPCRWHDLRHAMGSIMLDAGVPLPAVSKRLGHQRVSTTSDIYAHALTGADRQAADILAERMAKASAG